MNSKKIKRRDFLKIISAATCGSIVHHALIPYSNMLAYGATPTSGMLGDTTLILVNLIGGASHNIAPPDNGAYRDKFPNTFPDPVLDLNGSQYLHGALSTLKSEYDDGKLALFNLVGYPDPNRSHAESQDIWFRGAREGNNATMGGWAARLTCQVSSIFAGISLAGSNLLVQGDCNPPRTFGDFSNFGEDRFKWSTLKSKHLRDTRSNLIASANMAPGKNALYVTNAMNNMDKSVEIIKEQTEKPLPEITSSFPNSSFGRACEDAAKILAAKGALGTRFIFLQRGGFDTHSDEAGRLTGNLTDVNAGLAPLIETIKVLGLWDKVVIAFMSEFSRTFENGSAGTDHGHAGPLFVLGGRVQGGIKNPPPNASHIAAAGSYFANHEVDYRQIFKEIVVAMGFDGEAIFPGSISYTPYSFLG